MTTTTTEISSNSNSSCRLLDCLNTLPFHDQRAFRSLLGHIELVRLSACCRSLRSSIRNDTILWQEVYHRDFLSGAYYVKEMEFVLWCIRTDVNNPCTSDKRADLLENVDWYNAYRRRVSTENNWRYGRCKTTHIDMEHDKDGNCYSIDVNDNRIFIALQYRPDGTPIHSYVLEYLPHSNLRSNNNIVYNSTFSTSPNFLPLDTGNEAQYNFVLGGHYIAAYSRPFGSNTDYKVKILSRRHGGVFITLDVPVPYKVGIMEGKWALLVRGIRESYEFSPISNAMVFDIDNNIMCPGSIDDTWNARCFYKTTNNTAIVYTARLVTDDAGRIEWALYQFSNNNPVVQLRSGWFHLPEIQPDSLECAYNSSGSHVILQLVSSACRFPYVIHNVALGGQCSTPQNCYTISDSYLPIPLLQLGFRCPIIVNDSVKVWTDLSYSDDQILRFPGARSYRHVIGSLYLIITNQDSRNSRLLVDINTKEIIRKLEPTAPGETINIYKMVGTICNPSDMYMLAIHEYGEL